MLRLLSTALAIILAGCSTAAVDPPDTTLEASPSQISPTSSPGSRPAEPSGAEATATSDSCASPAELVAAYPRPEADSFFIPDTAEIIGCTTRFVTAAITDSRIEYPNDNGTQAIFARTGSDVQYLNADTGTFCAAEGSVYAANGVPEVPRSDAESLGCADGWTTLSSGDRVWLVDGRDYEREETFGTGYFFSSPSGNFTCALLELYALCEGQTSPVPDRPGSCPATAEWGNGMQVADVATPRFGQVEYLCATRSLTVPDAPTLPYGEALQGYGFTCVFDEAGTRCVDDQTSRGFRVARDSNNLI